MSAFMLATIGGSISFASTTFGALLSLVKLPGEGFKAFRLPIDFALGLMVSAVAFSLVGPAAVDAIGDWSRLAPIAFGLYAGVLLIMALRKLTARFELGTSMQSHLLLAIVLMVHNFPEGLASGAALAGLSRAQAEAVLSSIALQNIPEGLLMVVCLRALGVSNFWALLGGVGSGVIELLGGMSAGVLLGGGPAILPFLLASAGGAMLTSVLIEMKEQKKIRYNPFALGLLTVPLMNGVMTLLPG